MALLLSVDKGTRLSFSGYKLLVSKVCPVISPRGGARDAISGRIFGWIKCLHKLFISACVSSLILTFGLWFKILNAGILCFPASVRTFFSLAAFRTALKPELVFSISIGQSSAHNLC